MTNSDYQRLRAISSHWLIQMLHSPRKCFENYLDPMRCPDDPSDAMRLGTAVHALALTPQRWEMEILVMDYERRTKAGRAQYLQACTTGKTVVKPALLEHARAITAALKAHPEARRLLSRGKRERLLIQSREGGLLPLKARMDVHHEDKRQVVELKTTWNLDGATQAMERYRYPLSAAYYRHLSRSLSTVFVFVQTREPHDIAVIDFSREQLADGHEQWRAALSLFDECWRAGEWPEAEYPPSYPIEDDPLMMPFDAAPAAGPKTWELEL